jgi:hypothetical protein
MIEDRLAKIKALEKCPFCNFGLRLVPGYKYCAKPSWHCNFSFLRYITPGSKVAVLRLTFRTLDYGIESSFYMDNPEMAGEFGIPYLRVYSMVGPQFSPIFESSEPIIPDFSDLQALQERIKTIITFA